MITGTYTQNEILREFWSDYDDTIKTRGFSIAQRLKKDLLPTQKKRGDNEWLMLKKLYKIKSKGNEYNVILWVNYGRSAKNSTAIKTCCWCSFLDIKGRRRVILLPSNKTVNAIILFTPGFFKEWSEQEQHEENGRELEAEFFKWAEGNYVVYHNSEDHNKIEVDLNNKGAGVGIFKEPGTHIFKHYIGNNKLQDMRKQLGKNIMDPLELWEEFNKKPEITINQEETINYWEEENKKILDEIFEKYG